MVLHKSRVTESKRIAATLIHAVELRQELPEPVAKRIIATWLDLITQQGEFNERLASDAVRKIAKRIKKSAGAAATTINRLPIGVHILLGPLIDNLSTTKFSGMLPYAAASAEHMESLSLQLKQLSGAADRLLLSLKSKGGRPIEVQQRHLLAEIAFFYEFLSGQRATRRISGPDSGKQVPYGPFWSFLSLCWECVRENVRGLDGLLAQWLRERRPTWRLSVATTLRFRDIKLWNKLSNYGHPYLP